MARVPNFCELNENESVFNTEIRSNFNAIDVGLAFEVWVMGGLMFL